VKQLNNPTSCIGVNVNNKESESKSHRTLLWIILENAKQLSSLIIEAVVPIAVKSLFSSTKPSSWRNDNIISTLISKYLLILFNWVSNSVISFSLASCFNLLS